MQELDVSDQDDDRGIRLDPSKYASRSSPGGHNGFVGDELYFTGYDLSRARSSGSSPYDETVYGEQYGYSDEDEQYEYERQRYAAYVAAMREREDALVQSANEKLRKAKARGRNNVNLNQEELDALERRRLQQEQLLARTPVKGKSSRSNSAASLTNEKTKKRGNRFFSGPAASSSRTRSSKSPKTSRKPSLEKTSSAPPAFMLQGPAGQPVYPPYGYFPPPDNYRPPSGPSRPGSRSASASSKRQVTPPYDAAFPPYPAYPPRYYPIPDDLRPPPSPARRSPDDLYIPRHRAATSTHYPDELNLPPTPAAQGRRNVSGPPDISYSKLRRVAPSSPLAEQAPISSRSESQPDRRASQPDHRASQPDRRASQPARAQRTSSDSASGNGSGSSSSSSSEEDGQGVSVEIIPERKGEGYRIDRVPVGGGAERRRRSKR